MRRGRGGRLRVAETPVKEKTTTTYDEKEKREVKGGKKKPNTSRGKLFSNEVLTGKGAVSRCWKKDKVLYVGRVDEGKGA